MSQVEEILRHDPVGIYARMDFASRDRYRQAVEALADGTGEDQNRVAQQSVDVARAATPSRDDDRVAHVGYYLIGRGRPQLEQLLSYRLGLRRSLTRAIFRRPTLVYLGPILLMTIAFAAIAAGYAHAAGGAAALAGWAALIALLPASDLATAITQRFVSRLIMPRRLPRLELEGGVPAHGRTMVIVPTLFGSVETVRELLAHVEVQALGNLDPHVHFAVAERLPRRRGRAPPGRRRDCRGRASGHRTAQPAARQRQERSFLSVSPGAALESAGIPVDGVGAEARQDRGIQPSAPERR